MNYKIDYDNNSLILYPTGRIDVISARELDKEMEEISADFGNFDTNKFRKLRTNFLYWICCNFKFSEKAKRRKS